MTEIISDDPIQKIIDELWEELTTDVSIEDYLALIIAFGNFEEGIRSNLARYLEEEEYEYFYGAGREIFKGKRKILINAAVELNRTSQETEKKLIRLGEDVKNKLNDLMKDGKTL